MPDTAAPQARNHLFWSSLFLVALVGLLLRLWNIDFGLPDPNHRDEFTKYPVILRIATGQNPGYLLHPGLLVNSCALAWWVAHQFGVSDEFPKVILCGRILVAFLGAGTAIFAGILGRRLYGNNPGLLAAAALAMSPLHSMLSRYVKEDIHLVFGILGMTAALVEWSHATDPRRARLALAAAAFLCGWAMAAKYVGTLCLVFLLGWVWYGARAVHLPRRIGLLLLLAGASTVVFLLLSPQILDTSLRHDVQYELEHGLGQKNSLTLPFWQYPDWGTWFFRHGVGWGIGWPQALMGCAAIFLALRRGSAPERFVALSCLTWYCVAEATPVKLSGGVERYVAPAVAFLAVLAARFATSRRSLALCAGLLLVPTCHSALIARSITVDTRQAAQKWLAKAHAEHPFSLGRLRKPTEDDELDQNWLIMNIPFPYFKKDTLDKVDQLDAVALSSNAYSRYALSRWHPKSKEAMKNLKTLRKRFRWVIRFEVPRFLRVGTHNPSIEIRFKNEVPETHAE